MPNKLQYIHSPPEIFILRFDTVMKPGLKLRNMYKKVKSSVFFKLFIKFVTFKTCVFLPAVQINLQVKNAPT